MVKNVLKGLNTPTGVAFLQAADGSLVASDDWAGAVYRINYAQ